MRQQNDRDVVQRNRVDLTPVERNEQPPATNAKFDRALRKIENPSLHLRLSSYFNDGNNKKRPNDAGLGALLAV